MGDSILYSKQWRCCIPAVSVYMYHTTVLKLRSDWHMQIPLWVINWTMYQAFCLKSPDPFPSQRVGPGSGN